MDIVLSLNRDWISKVNLLNFGSPSFILDLARSMYPRVAMPNDFIVKVGEFADEMFFIKSGEVEVLATDNSTRIAILKQGAYFGEIGMLLTGVRSVSVRAIKICILETVNLSDFQKLMAKFPEQERFLKRVAKQRIKTTNPEDIKKKPTHKPSNKASSSPQGPRSPRIAMPEVVQQTPEPQGERNTDFDDDWDMLDYMEDGSDYNK